MKSKTLTTILAGAFVLATSCTSHDTGWGRHQGSNTVGGALGGATLGGIIGHQSGRRDEGILIGTMLGGFMGNEIGKGKDKQEEQARAAANYDHQLELERSRAYQLEKQLVREREINDLRHRQQRAEQELKQLRTQ